MARIFISYRSPDSAYITSALVEKLEQHFGRDSVYYDVDDLPFGVDYHEYLVDAIGKSDVLLAIIGEKWLSDVDFRGRRQIDNPGDLTRIEIETAFERNIPVIPVLVGEAWMPSADDLPESIRSLVYRNALEIRDMDSGQDIKWLIRGLEQMYKLAPTLEIDAPPVEKAEPPPAAKIKAPPEKPETNGETASLREINKSDSAQRNLIFISHSHKDKRWLELLKTHFKPFERAGRIKRWDDTEIKAGQAWKPEIEKAIQSAKVAILLISPDFLASDFIANDELPPLLAAAEEEGAMIISLIIKHSGYRNIETLARFQSFNPPEKPLDGMSSARRNKILSDLTTYTIDIVKGS